ncbi:MAG: hypothetical protein FJ022_02840 [Chloroflexi bacterium]|nr:hypothetical protein [Chloroflexota bacterium]MBM4449729.1 hypothetical protein [Chloroflexota bacterium]
MTDEAKRLLDFVKLMLRLFLDDRSASEELTKNITTMSDLVDELGHNMRNELRVRWRDRIAEALTDCDRNTHGFPDGIQRFYATALRELFGSFYEMVEEDYAVAGKFYEEAALTISPTKDVVVSQVESELKSRLLAKGRSEEEVERDLPTILSLREAPDVNLMMVSLLDRAADCYFRWVEESNGTLRLTVGTAAEAQRCYEHGLGIIRAPYPELEDARKVAELDKYRCHLALSLAGLLLTASGEWERAEALYKEAADAVFFNKEEKSSDQYYDLCSIINGFGATNFFLDRREEHLPHNQFGQPFQISGDRYKESFRKLAVELGQKALDILRAEVDGGKEDFPIPETFYLVGILSYFYRDLGQYEKCVDLVPLKTKFGSTYWVWVWEQLDGEVLDSKYEWVTPHIVHCREMFYAQGLLQRPDYKDLQEAIEKLRGQLIEGLRGRTEGAKQREWLSGNLVGKHPWLVGTANLGSLTNAEYLYQELAKQNWAEVVMGYCNAVEAELKEYIYKKHLAFIADFDKQYAEASQRRKEEGAVLGFIASINKGGLRYKFWERFVNAEMNEHREFVLKELPALLSQLVPIRNKAAHGETLERKHADQVHEIVLGRQGNAGLLEKLSTIRPGKSGT